MGSAELTQPPGDRVTLDNLIERAGPPKSIELAMRTLAGAGPNGDAAATRLVYKALVDAIDNVRTLDDLSSALASAEISRRLSPSDKGEKTSVAAVERLIARAGSLDWDNRSALTGLATLIELTQDLNSKQVFPLIKHLQRGGHGEDAEILIRAMLRLTPFTVGAFKAAMTVADDKRRGAIVEEHFGRLRSRGEEPEARKALAYGHLMIGEFRIAAEIYRALPASSCDATVAAMFAEALFWTDDFVEAIRVVRTARASNATMTPKVEINLAKLEARCLIALGNGDQAADALDACKASVADAYVADATDVYANLSAGRYADAFDSYWSGPRFEALRSLPAETLDRSDLADARDHGRRIEGECCILSLMGVGDEVRMAQMLPEIAALFDRVTMFADRRLAPIFARSFPSVAVVGVDPADPVVGANPYLHAHMDNSALERIAAARFVADMRQFPAILRRDGYAPDTGHTRLSVDPAIYAEWNRTLASASDEPAIGLFWRSDISAFTARHKQTSLSDWLTALSALPVKIVPLQYGLSDQERATIEANNQFLKLPPAFDPRADLEELFGLLAALPLTIALPGSTQHMAGAVGATVICPAHPFEAAWRRRRGSDSELWAPTVEVVCGLPELGLEGSIEAAVARLKIWLEGMSHRSETERRLV